MGIFHFLIIWCEVQFISLLHQFSSVQLLISNSLWSHGLQHARLPCPSPTPRVYADSCPLSQWWPSNHLNFCCPLLLPPSIFPSIRVFSKSQFFASGGQSIGVSALISVLPMNIQDWFPLELTGLILQSKGLSRVFSNTTVQKHQFFGTQLSLSPTLTSICDYWKNHRFG